MSKFRFEILALGMLATMGAMIASIACGASQAQKSAVASEAQADLDAQMACVKNNDSRDTIDACRKAVQSRRDGGAE